MGFEVSMETGQRGALAGTRATRQNDTIDWGRVHG
jgi:hypothetical protein